MHRFRCGVPHVLIQRCSRKGLPAAVLRCCGSSMQPPPAPASRKSNLFDSLTPEEIRAQLAAAEAELEYTLRQQTGDTRDADRVVADANVTAAETATVVGQANEPTPATAAAAETVREGQQQQQQQAEPLWPNCDTLEDIMEEEKYGAPGELPPVSDEEHVRLAYRALMYGTVIAIAMTAASALTLAYFFGFRSWADVKAHLQGNEARRLAELQRVAAAADASEFGGDTTNSSSSPSAAEQKIRHFTLDITQPATLPAQLEALMGLIEELALEQQRDKELQQAPKDSVE